jgi:hypothetical protein
MHRFAKLFPKSWDNPYYYSPSYMMLCASNENRGRLVEWEFAGIREKIVELIDKNRSRHDVLKIIYISHQ